MKYLKCDNCGYIHFEISLEKASDEVERFNKYFDSLTKDQQMLYYGGHKSSLETYMECIRCGGHHRNFSDATRLDIDDIDGHTINPILSPKA